MVIHRILHGQNIDIELTHDELIDTYFEQQHNFDMQDVEEGIASYDFPSDINDKLLMHLAEIATDMRKIINVDFACDPSWSPSWQLARDQAIKNQIKKLKEEKKEKKNEKGQL